MHLPRADGTSGASAARGLAILFALIACLAGLDMAADLGDGADLPHVALEIAIAAIGLAGLSALGVYLIRIGRRERALRDELAAVTDRLDRVAAEATRWRERAGDLLRGLGETIDEQLARWDLTPAEKEVALLLLKGLSSREIAVVRGVAEPTIRQQSRSIYRKTGLAGRRELAAFFLEDLLLPSS